MNYIKLVHSKLSVEEISNMVSSPRCGAISLFVGTTRDSFQEHKVLQLEYEAYESMAVKAMSDICDEIRKKWCEIEHIAIYHRLGIVPIQEASVVIAVSSPHRVESLEAVSYTIEALKASVPIWKKEVYDSNKPAEWKENTESSNKRLKIEGPSAPDAAFMAQVNFTPINKKLVQIKADDKEIEHRIRCFIERKRNDLNASNKREFCSHSFQAEEGSCARVDALVFRRSNSKGHLKVRREVNRWGPQSRSIEVKSEVEMPRDGAPAMATPVQEPTETNNTVLQPAIQERLFNAEKHIGIDRPVSKDVYARLKDIETRILYLEGVSPEYATFWVTQSKAKHPQTLKPGKKKTYSLDDLESKIQQYQQKTDIK